MTKEEQRKIALKHIDELINDAIRTKKEKLYEASYDYCIETRGFSSALYFTDIISKEEHIKYLDRIEAVLLEYGLVSVELKKN